MIPPNSVRGSRRISTFSSIYPARTLQTALAAALVVFLLGSLVHGHSLFGPHALGSITVLKPPPPPKPAAVLDQLAPAQVLTTQALPPAGSPLPVAAPPQPAMVQPQPQMVAAFQPQAQWPQPTPQLQPQQLLQPAAVPGAVPGAVPAAVPAAVPGAVVPQQQPPLLTTPPASPTPLPTQPTIAPNTTKTTPTTTDNHGADMIGPLPANGVVKIAFSLKAARSLTKCADLTDQTKLLCDDIAKSIGTYKSFTDLPKEASWTGVMFPSSTLLMTCYILAHVLVGMAALALTTPVMALNGNNKRLIGSSLMDVAVALAGAVIGWQRWKSIALVDSVIQHLKTKYPTLSGFNKELEPPLGLVVLIAALWTLAAFVLAFEWIFHSRDNDNTRRTDNPPPPSDNPALDEEEVALLLNPPANLQD